MVEVKRIELLRRPCKGPRLPLHQTPENLVPQAGIEPTHPAYKTGPLPLRIQGLKFVLVYSLLASPISRRRI